MSSNNDDVMMPDVNTMKQAKEMRELAPDSDAVAFAKATVELIVDYFKILMASLLSVFVPQACPLLNPPTAPPVCADAYGPVQTTYELWYTFNTTTHDCSLDENFTNLTDFNKFVLGWNFITLGIMLFHYTLTWRREKFCTRKLKQSILVSKIYLMEVLPKYPKIESELYWYNKHVFVWSVIGGIAQTINIIVSGILIFRDYYEGTRSVTTFFTSILLVATVMQSCAQTAWTGMHHNLAYSCVIYEPISYNDIDDRQVVIHDQTDEQQTPANNTTP